MDKIPLVLWMLGYVAIAEWATQKDKDRPDYDKEDVNVGVAVVWVVGILILFPW